MTPEHTLHATLAEDGRPEAQPVRVIAGRTCLSVLADGYGHATTADGHGSSVCLTLRGGELVLYVWADIADEEPTHVLALGGAREVRLPADGGP